MALATPELPSPFQISVPVMLMQAVTVNVEEHIFGASQSLVAVQVTVVLPPNADGGKGVTGVVVSTVLQPPETDTVASQLEKAVFIAICVWQAGSITGEGQMRETEEGATTVIVRDCVLVRMQASVYVHVSVNISPQVVYVPEMVLITEPLISQAPVSPFV